MIYGQGEAEERRAELQWVMTSGVGRPGSAGSTRWESVEE